jgi:hypothetical protein
MIKMQGWESVEEYADRTHYSVSTVRKLIKKRAVKSRKVKGRIYIWIE